MRNSFLTLMVFSSGLFSSVFLADSPATADDAPLVAQPKAAADEHSRPTPSESNSYQKSDKFLAGEEVHTSTGQKIKIWSTEGPVKVSPPPKPFDFTDGTQLDDLDVVLGGPKLTLDPQDDEAGLPATGEDSFDLRD